MDHLCTLAARVELARGKADHGFEVTASTNEINTHGYRVDQAGWVLDRYAANPVVLYGHQRDASNAIETIPIGRAENVRIEGGELRASLVIGTHSELARSVKAAFEQDMLHAVSVGFMPLDVVVEMQDGREILTVKRAELHEISVVPLPADAGAVRARHARDTTHLAMLAAGQRGGTLMPDTNVTTAVPVANPPGIDAELLSLTGETTLDAALGVLRGWREAASQRDELSKRVEQLTGEIASRDVEALVAEGKASSKLTPALEAEVREVAKLSIDRARALVRSLPTVTSLSAPTSEPTSGAQLSKRWEEFRPIELARLAEENPEHFQALRADHLQRRRAVR